MARIPGDDLDNLLDAVALGFGGDDNTIVGGRGRDTLIGGSGNDTLIGGFDRDFMEGNDGDDLYFVHGDDRLFDVTENANQGFDTVISPVFWRLGENFEKLILAGSSDIQGTGNDRDNTIIGNVGNNILKGLGGNDILNGLAGNDRLEGASGDDNLDGGPGDDILVGGAGNDKYFVESLNDVITEQANAGSDQVFVRVDGYTLSANVESLFLGAGVFTGTGSNDNNYIQGNTEDNILNGGGGDDFLNGRRGNNILNGGEGNDRLDGGSGINILNGDLGNDQYFVRNAGDAINENTGEGTDTVNSLLVNYDLPSTEEVENLVLVEVDPLNLLAPPVAVTGTGNDLANKITGNSLDNTLNGGGGNDTLDGSDGADELNGGDDDDILNGGEGSDTLNGDAGNDLLNGDAGEDELNGGEGDDKLRGGDDNDILNGGNGSDELRGDANNDTLNGDAGDDRLEGGDGSDTLTGGAGNDLLFGGAGDDILIGDPGALGGGDGMFGGDGSDLFVLADSTRNFYDDGDPLTRGLKSGTIRDFEAGIDQIQLKNAIGDYLIEPQGVGNVKIRTNEAIPELIAIILNTTVNEVENAIIII